MANDRISGDPLVEAVAGAALAGVQSGANVRLLTAQMNDRWMEHFGALGENLAADQAAFISATLDRNAAGGGVTVCKPGRTYYFDRMGGATPIAITGPARIDLNVSTFTRPDGVVAGNNYRMVFLELGDGASLDMGYGTLDANYTGNPKTGGEGNFDWEQNTTFYVTVAAGAAARWIKYHDLILKDREVADHLRVFCNAGATLELLHVDNVRSETTNNVIGRGDVIWYRGIKQVLIENCPYLHAVEAEFTVDEDDRETLVTIRDCTIGRLDLGFDGISANKRCYLERVKAEKIDAIAGAYFYTKDCVLVLGPGAGEFVRPEFWEDQGSEIHIPAGGWNFAAIIASQNSICTFLRTEIRIADGEAAPGADVLAILFPNNTTAGTFKSTLTFEDCLFDLNDFDRIGHPSGNVTLRRNTYRCKGDYAFTMSAASREQKLTVENKRGGFAHTALVSLRFDNWDAAVATDSLELSGPWEDGVDKPMTYVNGKPNTTFTLRNFRRLTGAALPDESVTGDEFRFISKPGAGTWTRHADDWATTGAIWS